MKVQSWWVKPGLLMSGNDPTNEMSIAAAQFPPDSKPRAYMTGDGHRKPPFEWAAQGVWAGLFKQLIERNEICCHVETFSGQVKPDSVPELFEPVLCNHKVFGFEPDVFQILKEIINNNYEIRPKIESGEDVKLSIIREVFNAMWNVGRLKYLVDEAKEAKRQVDNIKKLGVDPVPAKALPLWSEFLSKYNNAAMELRTGVNHEFGANIQKIIQKFPNDVHMITCGDAHIKVNPLYQYIQLPIGCYGFADEHQVRPVQ
jgi:hypothetical protein